MGKVAGAATKSFLPEETFVAFVGAELLYCNYASGEWAWGSAVSPLGSAPLAVPEHAAIVKLDREKHNCEHSHAFVLGGLSPQGAVLNWAFGLEFKQEGSVDGGAEMKLGAGYSDESFVLPTPRMMHQACIVGGANGNQLLLVIGGKEGAAASNCQYSASVLAFDLKLVFEPWLKGTSTEVDAAHRWRAVASMNSARANFATTVVDNMVYAYGGIQGRGEGESAHVPVLATIVAERYDPGQDAWEEIAVNGAPPLAAFGWTSLAAGSGQILVLGGTDGDVIQQDVWTIDFK